MHTKTIAFKKQIFLFAFILLYLTGNCQRNPKLVIESGNEMPVLKNDIFFSKNNRFLALTGSNQIKIYDLKTGFLLKKIKQEKDYSYPSFSSDFNNYAFTRLQIWGEPGDSVSFNVISETFSDKYLYKQHHTTNDYNHTVRLVNNYVVLHDNDSLHFINMRSQNKDTVLLTTPHWTFNNEETLLLLQRKDNSQKYYVLNLQNFDTLYKVDFSQNNPEQNFSDGDFISASASFSSDSRYIIFSTRLLSAKKKIIKVYDCEKGTIIFSKLYPVADYGSEILSSVNFSAISGAVTLPEEKGLGIYNAYNSDSFFIPLTKRATGTEVYMSADGKNILINDSTRILIYNALSGKKVFDKSFDYFRDVVVNPKFNYVYISSYFLDPKKETLVFNTETEKIISKIEGQVLAASPDGKIVFGKLGLADYLLNQFLQPLKSINNCTPFTEAAISGNESLTMLIKNNPFCDIANNGISPNFDFSAWNIERLTKYKNDVSFFAGRFNALRSYNFYNNNFYFTTGPFIYSFTDTFQTAALNKNYGTLEGMKGNYLIFLKMASADTLDNALPPAIDTITVLKDIKTPLAKFIINTAAYVYSMDIDTLKKQVAVFSDDEQSTGKKNITIYDYTGKQLAQHSFNLSPGIDVYSAFIKELSPDGKYAHLAILKGYESGTQHVIIDLTTGRQICDLTVTKEESFVINWNTKKYFHADQYNSVSINSFSGSKLKYKIYPIAVNDSVFLGLQPLGNFNNNTPDSLIVSLTTGFKIVLMNWQKNDTLYAGKEINDYITTGGISKDNKWFAYANKSFEIILVNLRNNKSYTLKRHTDYINNLCFNGNELFSSSFDGTNTIWSLDSLKEIVTFVNLRDDDYLISSPEGFYTSTKKAQSQFSFVSGNTAIAPQQLDLFYNRPDILLRKTGCTDSVLINSYQTAWQKRIKRSGFANDDISKIFYAPSLEILNIDSIELTTNKPSLTLNIKANDSATALKSFNVWINECPLFSAKGINISQHNSNNFDTTVTIFLSDSSNVIEAAVTNNYGVESYRQPLYIKYVNTHPAKQTTWFIGIGVNDYLQQDKHLNYAVKDIQDLNDLFQSATKKENNNFHSVLLLNDKAVKENILAIKDSLMQTQINDKVIFAFSGHGLQSDSLDFYLATSDVDFNKPEIKGVLYQDFEDILDSIPSRNKLILIDACHSGETDKEEAPANKSSISAQLQNVKSTVAKKNLGLQNSFELMQQLFADITKSNGATVISAARGGQFANEGDEWNNGAFTYCVKQGLLQQKADINNDGKISINELKDYVSREVEKITKGSQQPTARKELIANDWIIWQ